MMRPPPVMGKVIYSDPMGTRYVHGFAFVASSVGGEEFMRYGGKKYNYDEEMED